VDVLCAPRKTLVQLGSSCGTKFCSSNVHVGRGGQYLFKLPRFILSLACLGLSRRGWVHKLPSVLRQSTQFSCSNPEVVALLFAVGHRTTMGMKSPFWRLCERFYSSTEPPPRVRTKPMQVLCVGLPRSGTESLQKALLRLGYDYTYHVRALLPMSCPSIRISTFFFLLSHKLNLSIRHAC
jgi:Sulfotransferase domain